MARRSSTDDSWEDRAVENLWYCCAQMKDYEVFPPLQVKEASGSHIVLADGTKLIDAISSWWCKTLGHAHPRLTAALCDQAHRAEHVMLAHMAVEPVVELASKLARLFPGLTKVFFGGDGSTAIEISVKMSFEAQRISGHTGRTKVLALENDYHGETQLCAALSDVGAYQRGLLPAFGAFPKLRGLPYVRSSSDPLWADCSSHWPGLLRQLEDVRSELCAVIVEPILQGASGMRVYSADLLRRLREWTLQNGVHLIADEILTGFGRTGRLMACESAQVVPDFACLSKGLTGGFLPMSAVVTSEAVYATFYGEHDEDRAFNHSNTFAGNALAAAVAVEALRAYEAPAFLERVSLLERQLHAGMAEVSEATGALGPIRGIGGVVAADLKVAGGAERKRIGFRVYREAAMRGALVRPIGDTLYWLPPLNVESLVLDDLTRITIDAVRAAIG
jgi:adenosylmethionine---8-amino-7-oxononanoate aminotransferase